MRFDPLISPVWGPTHQEYHLALDGAVSPAYWQFRIKAMRDLLENRGMLQWWSEYGAQFSDGFSDLVDGLIRECEAAE